MARADLSTLAALADGQAWGNASRGAFATLLAGSGGAARLVATASSPAWAKEAAHYVGDGTADDVEINSALTDLPSTGGVVVLAPGTFNLANTVNVTAHGTLLVGSGAGQRTNASQNSDGTKLQVVAGFAGTAAVRVASGTAPLHGVTLRDFAVDGDAIGTGVAGIHFRSHTGLVDHVHVHRMSGDGVHVQGYTDGQEGATTSWATYESLFIGLVVSNCGAAGFRFGTQAQDCHLASTTLYDNNDNVRIQAGSQQLTDVHTYSGVRYNVWFDGSGSRTKIVNLKCEQAGQHGVYLDGTTVGGSDVMIVGSNFKNNGHSVDNTYDNIHVGGGAAAWSRLTVVGCNFSVAVGTAGDAYDLRRARHAVYLGSNSRSCLVADIQVGSGHLRGANVNDSGPTDTNRNFVGIGTGLSYVTNPNGSRTYFGGGSQPSSMLAGDYWMHDA